MVDWTLIAFLGPSETPDGHFLTSHLHLHTKLFLFVVNGKPEFIRSNATDTIKINCSVIDTIWDKLISFQPIRSEYLR